MGQQLTFNPLTRKFDLVGGGSDSGGVLTLNTLTGDVNLIPELGSGITISLDGNNIVIGSTGEPATQSPKLIVDFDTDVDTSVSDLCVVNGDHSVTRILSNDISEIPSGIFGVVIAKPTTTTASVIFVGVSSGYSGFGLAGQTVYVGTDGRPTITNPNTEMVQQIGFTISDTEFFVYIKLPIRKSS